MPSIKAVVQGLFKWQFESKEEMDQREAAKRQQQLHDEAMVKYRKTKNPEDMPGNHFISPPGREDGNLSLKGQIANWKACEAPVAENMDIRTLNLAHQRLMEAWKTCDTAITCSSLFKSKILSQKKQQITSCMCLGLGSLSGLRSSQREWEDRSMSQVVVFESWLEPLSEYMFKFISLVLKSEYRNTTYN